MELTRSTSNTNGIKYFTGLAPVSLLAINPTHDELKTITDNPNIPESLCNYDVRYNTLMERDEKPLMLWFKHEDSSPFPVSLSVANSPVMSKNGKVKFINGYGKISSYVTSIDDISNNPRMSWFSTSNVKQLLQGEEELYTILKQLYRIDETKEEWLKFVIENNLTADKLFAGNKQAFDALKSFVDSCKDSCVVGLLIVKKSESDGKEKLRQELLINTDLLFRTTTCQVTDTMLTKLQQVESSAKSRDVEITKRLYTHKFQEFSEADCVNSAPSSVIQSKWL